MLTSAQGMLGCKLGMLIRRLQQVRNTVIVHEKCEGVGDQPGLHVAVLSVRLQCQVQPQHTVHMLLCSVHAISLDHSNKNIGRE